MSERPTLARLYRVVGVVLAVLLSGMPAWAAMRAVAAVCASAASEGQAGTAGAVEEEEVSSASPLPRHEIELRRGEVRRGALVAAASPSERLRAEWESARINRKWGAHVAPPRAPPMRLLN
ncbi:MAG: hypothetical protein R3F14_14210 [Polyangiaceae bacterium]